MEHTFVSALLLMFLMADPLGNIPIFISALKQVPAARRTKIILRECAIAALILSVFAFGGRSFLDALGLSQAALSIGGGLIVLLMAIRMLPDGDNVFGLYGDFFDSVGSHGLPLCGGGIQRETGNSFVELSNQPKKGAVCKAGAGVCLYHWRNAPVRSGDPGCVLSNRITVSALF